MLGRQTIFGNWRNSPFTGYMIASGSLAVLKAEEKFQAPVLFLQVWVLRNILGIETEESSNTKIMKKFCLGWEKARIFRLWGEQRPRLITIAVAFALVHSASLFGSVLCSGAGACVLGITMPYSAFWLCLRHAFSPLPGFLVGAAHCGREAFDMVCRPRGRYCYEERW